MLDDELTDPIKKAKEHYTKEVVEENLNAIKSFSSKMLSALSDVFLNSSKDNGGCLQVIKFLTTWLLLDIEKFDPDSFLFLFLNASVIFWRQRCSCYIFVFSE